MPRATILSAKCLLPACSWVFAFCSSTRSLASFLFLAGRLLTTPDGLFKKMLDNNTVEGFNLMNQKLKELAEKCGASSILIDGADELDFEILSKYKSIGITAGASAPESIVQNVVQAISLELNAVAEELGKNKENIYFRLPPELR